MVAIEHNTKPMLEVTFESDKLSKVDRSHRKVFFRKLTFESDFRTKLSSVKEAFSILKLVAYDRPKRSAAPATTCHHKLLNPHRIACTQCMRDGQLPQISHVAWSVCLCVGQRVSCAQMTGTDRDAVWGTDS